MATDGHEDAASFERREDIGLKYLDFVYLAALKALGIVGVLYEFAKENSGRLIRPGFESVEGIVKAVVCPVYHRIEGKPLELLHFFDSKVDESLTTLDARLLQYGREKLHRMLAVLLRAPHLVRSFITEVQENGVCETARAYYAKYEPVAEDLSYTAWRRFLKLPVVPNVVNVAAPAIIFGAKEFNDVVALFKYHHFPLAAWIPVIAVEKLDRAVKIQAD